MGGGGATTTGTGFSTTLGEPNEGNVKPPPVALEAALTGGGTEALPGGGTEALTGGGTGALIGTETCYNIENC